jgi:hypothetical protein
MTPDPTSPAASDDRPLLRIAGPGDLLDALPRMLGYVPRRSAVLVALRPPRGRLVMTMRVDLPPARGETACAHVLAGHAHRAGAASAVLVVYDDRALGGGRWRGGTLSRAVRTALRQRGGLRLDDALAVRDGRWRSLLCRDERCCPPEGQPLRSADDVSAAAAMLAVEGAAVLPDRESLVASLAAPTGDRAQALARLFVRLTGAALEPAAARRAFSAAIEDRRDGRSPSDEEAARLVLALADFDVRDAVLSRAAEPDTDTLLALLLDLGAVAVPPFDPPPLATLAWVAYARGDGTVANIAVDRALASDPTYSLALLIASGLDAGLHPKHVRRVSRDVGHELRSPRARHPPGGRSDPALGDTG